MSHPPVVFSAWTLFKLLSMDRGWPTASPRRVIRSYALDLPLGSQFHGRFVAGRGLERPRGLAADPIAVLRDTGLADVTTLF